MDNQNLGEIIKAARKKQGKTLKEFADEIGIDPSTLQRYEAGTIKNIPYDKLKKITVATNATLPIASSVLGIAGAGIGILGGLVGVAGGIALGAVAGKALTKSLEKSQEDMFDFYNSLEDMIFFFRNPKINQSLKDEIFEQLQTEYFKNKYK